MQLIMYRNPHRDRQRPQLDLEINLDLSVAPNRDSVEGLDSSGNGITSVFSSRDITTRNPVPSTQIHDPSRSRQEPVIRTKFNPFEQLLNGDRPAHAAFRNHSQFVEASLRSVLEDAFYTPLTGCDLRKRVAKEILGHLFLESLPESPHILCREGLINLKHGKCIQNQYLELFLSQFAFLQDMLCKTALALGVLAQEQECGHRAMAHARVEVVRLLLHAVLFHLG